MALITKFELNSFVFLGISGKNEVIEIIG